MTRDLFGESPPAPTIDPFARASYTARRVRVGAAVFVVHPCGVCGAATAPFGSGVHLREALSMTVTTREEGLAAQRRAGKWLCGTCREGGTTTAGSHSARTAGVAP